MNKLTALIAAFVLIAANFSAVSAQKATAKAAAPATDVVALLPASDIVAVSDMRRTNDLLQQIFASNPVKLAEINKSFDHFKTQTGIDVRQFERVAIGVKYNRTTAGKIDFAPVAVTRGSFNATGLVGVAKIALNGKYREEKVGSRSLLVVSLKDIAAQLPQPTDAAKANDLSKIIAKLTTGEVAFHAVDQNTLAFGDLKQVRAMIETNVKTAANADLIALANRNPNAVLNFAGNIPSDLQSLLRFDNDEIGNILASLRQAFGSVDIAGGNTNFVVAARTETADQAKNLKETLLGLQSLSGLLRARKGNKNEIIAGIAENLKISQTSNEIELRASVPQSALDVLLGGK